MPSRERLADLACLALLGLAVAAFFWPLLLTEAWIPRGGGDLVSFLWPMYRFAARSLRSGTVPLWNPHLHSGAPFLADNQSGLFYPVNLLAFAVLGPPSYAAMEGLVVFHVWIAAAAMYVLLRGLELRRSAAMAGALAYALSDLFVTHIGNLNLSATAAWLPLSLWFTHRAVEQISVSWAAAAGAVLATAALAGHGQMLLFTAATLMLYLLYRVVVLIAEGLIVPRATTLSNAWRTAGLGLVVATVGVGGAALTLLPAFQMVRHTGRGHLPYEEATRYSLPPRAMIGLVAPGFYGRGAADFWAPWDRVEVGYTGVATLVLASGGLTLRASSRLSTPVTWPSPSQGHRGGLSEFPFAFFALLIPLAFLGAFGHYTPVYPLLYRWVPIIDQIRAPARLIIVADLGLAALAAYGLDQLSAARCSSALRWPVLGTVMGAITVLFLSLGLSQARSVPPPDRVTQATWSVVLAAALLALSGSLIGMVLRWPWARWLFPFLLAVDLIGLGSTLEIERNDPTLGFEHDDVVAFLRRDPSLFRIDGRAAAWQPDAALMHTLHDIGGVYNPLSLAPYQAYRWAVGEGVSPLYNLLGVKYVLTNKDEPPGDERLVLAYSAAPQLDVYLNTTALPRALFVTCQRVVADHEHAWQAIHAPSFAPSQTIVLEEEDVQGADLSPADCGSSVDDVHISFVHYGLNEVEIAVESPVAGWLLLSDVYYPGWQATVDDTSAPLLRADYTFRALKVPAGSHHVAMVFAPWTWRAGLAVSVSIWAAIAAGAGLKLHSKRLARSAA